MTAEPQAPASSAAHSPDLSWPGLLRLGAVGLLSDIRDRREDPALRKAPSRQALDFRLRQPVFIIGAPRSGTTFLAGCIGRLPEVSYHFEPRLTKAAAQKAYDGSWSEQRAAAVFRLSYSALLLAALDGGRRFAEKNPENCFILPFLDATFPGAQFVHIVRDGRDAAVSHAEQPWLRAASAGAGRRGRSGQLMGPYARWWVERDRAEEFARVPDIVRSAWCWRRFTESAFGGLASLPPGRSIEVRYESMVADPAETAGRLAGFLGVSPAGAAKLSTALAGAKTSSVGRWRSALSESDLELVSREIGPLLTELGYA